MSKYLKKLITIIYEDNDMVVVEKPATVLSIPDRFDSDIPNVYHILQRGFGLEVYPVHRLDKDTSGVLCFAKNKEAHSHICKQFEERSTIKKYLALVVGNTIPKKGIIDNRIGPDNNKAGKMKVDPNGKEAFTEYEVIENLDKYVALSVQIKTGRTHQIRVHLSHIGHPLAIDPLYGNPNGIYLSSFKSHYNQSKNRVERPIMNRLTLHALKLIVTHPKTNEKMEFNSDLPKDFAVLRKLLKKYGKMTVS